MEVFYPLYSLLTLFWGILLLHKIFSQDFYLPWHPFLRLWLGQCFSECKLFEEFHSSLQHNEENCQKSSSLWKYDQSDSTSSKAPVILEESLALKAQIMLSCSLISILKFLLSQIRQQRRVQILINVLTQIHISLG